MDVVLIASPDDPRTVGFQNAMTSLGYRAATVVTYADLIQGTVHLADVVTARAWVRIESPGKDPLSNRLLLAMGNAPDIPTEAGRMLPPHHWYAGLCRFLEMVTGQCADCPPHRLSAHPDDIKLMFDKAACHQFLQQHDLAVAPALPPVHDYDGLRTAMQTVGWRRVFVKPQHGSSAAGVVAYQTNGVQHSATAPIELVTRDGQVLLYNTRRIRTYHAEATIARLLDAVCAGGVHVEAWIPKARMGDKAFDLRVVVINGRATHVVARLSRHPMTNLHLMNERQPRDVVAAVMGEDNLQRAMALCERAMAHFPQSLMAGIDLLVAIGYRQHVILEMNAFGDLLHHVTHHGHDTYTTQILAMAAMAAS